MEAHIMDLETIASSSSNDFDSILGAYDRAGGLLSKVSAVYGNYISSLNTPDMQIVQTKMAPILSRHNSKCYNIPGLFAKIEHMHNVKEDMLAKGEWTAEQVRLAERVYIGFVRMGAKLNEEEKKEYADIKGESISVIEM
jgi:peptidyl-dipeptidase Dcp